MRLVSTQNGQCHTSPNCLQPRLLGRGAPFLPFFEGRNFVPGLKWDALSIGGGQWNSICGITRDGDLHCDVLLDIHKQLADIPHGLKWAIGDKYL